MRTACAVMLLALVIPAMRAAGADAPVHVGGRAPALIVPTLDARVFDLAASPPSAPP